MDNVKDASTGYRSVRFEFKKTGIYKVSTVNGVVEGTWELTEVTVKNGQKKKGFKLKL